MALYLLFMQFQWVQELYRKQIQYRHSKILIYNAWWFEAIHVFFMINFIGNIKRYQLLKKENGLLYCSTSLLFFIILGAFVTRYISYEGMMPIREGAAENQIFSDKTFLTVFVTVNSRRNETSYVRKQVLFSPATDNDFNISGNFADTPLK
jgi:hypothetical protein